MIEPSVGNPSHRQFFHSVAVLSLLGTILGTLVAPNDTDSNDRSQGDGSNLFGEHNFRTGQADSGADPDGWYEEDM